jgi:hypothetical protein
LFLNLKRLIFFLKKLSFFRCFTPFSNKFSPTGLTLQLQRGLNHMETDLALFSL